jgi:hypothetical protein
VQEETNATAMEATKNKESDIDYTELKNAPFPTK